MLDGFFCGLLVEMAAYIMMLRVLNFIKECPQELLLKKFVLMVVELMYQVLLLLQHLLVMVRS